ncbi:MAG: glycosyltransferase [Planctomycetes bacterium]|nr:glycosyltransferase [Planctomycetota bacterium]
MKAVSSPNAVATAASDALADIEPLECSALLTHHWLVRRRGGERVLEALCELLPDSPVYTLVYDPDGFQDAGRDEPCHPEEVQRPRDLGNSDKDAPLGAPPFQGWGTDSRPVRTSFLQHIPGAKRHYPKLLPLMPMAARRMRLPPVDLVVCSDAAVAKAMTPDPRSKVVCYCHSPARYVWDLADTYRQTLPAFLRPFWPAVARRVREADRRAAQRVDQFVANSHHVAKRIRRHYGRDSVVVHPPVDLPPAPATGPRENFYLCVGQHVHYKRLDLAVEACRKLKRRLLVIGEGPDVRRYEKLRDPTIEFLGWQAGPAVCDYYRRARALLFPGEEDFGIVPVEAMAHGCPVIAYGVGGATESMVHGKTGVWFEEQTVACLVAAIERADAMVFDPIAMHASVQRFSHARFLREMRAVLVSVL